MKSFLRKTVLWLLVKMAKFRMRGYKGKIIAITGSVGKSSAKEAIYSVLNSQFRVKKTPKSMNSEFGLPLTILDIESGFSSATKWTWLLLKAFVHSFSKEYSEVMVLEYGVDKPGDMKFLTSILTPDVAVFTEVSGVHLAEDQFKDVDEIFKEKRYLVDTMYSDGIAILNIDNERIEGLAKEFAKELNKKQLFTFGKSRDADLRATAVKTLFDGLTFTLNIGDTRSEVKHPIWGDHQIYVLLPAIAAGLALGMNLEQVLESLKRFTLPPGRMNRIEGVEGVTIIDSSYNSSPLALKSAIDLLDSIAGQSRRVAVLGDMNELGEKSKELHEKIGKYLVKKVDFLITVGDQAQYIANSALEAGLEKDIVHKFKTAKAAADFYETVLKEKDLVLVKGSQNNIRLERFIKIIMKHPEDAKDLLVRQEKYWSNIV